LILAWAGACSMAHPVVMVITFRLFVGTPDCRSVAVVGAAGSVGEAPLATVGIAIALFLFFSTVFEFYFLCGYWA